MAATTVKLVANGNEYEWEHLTIKKSEMREQCPTATGALREGSKFLRPTLSNGEEYQLEVGHTYEIVLGPAAPVPDAGDYDTMVNSLKDLIKQYYQVKGSLEANKAVQSIPLC